MGTGMVHDDIITKWYYDWLITSWQNGESKMPLKARMLTTIKGAYTVHLEDLSKLWALMEDKVGNVTAVADCSDKVQRIFDSLEDLASYDNFSTKQIMELSLSARSLDRYKFVSIEFSQVLSYSIKIAIECPDDELLLLKDRILDILDAMRHQVLSYLVSRDTQFGIAFLLPSWIIVRIVSNLILFGTIVPSNDVSHDAGFWLNYIVMASYSIFPLMLVGYGLYKLRAVLVPSIYFAIGQGVSRYENWKERWRLGLGAIIAVVIGIIAIIVSVISQA